MRRGDRLFELIEILRSARGPVSAEAISDTLEVSKRTVYRDMAALMAQRVPIRGEAGIGYVLEAGFHMPPLMLTSDEIDAAILGAQWVQSRGEPELARAAERLIAKFGAVAPDSLQQSFVDPGTGVAPVQPPREALGASDIRQAIRQHRKISLQYRDDKGTKTERVVWPIMLGYRDSGRIIAAWCELRRGYRYFRTERILEAEVLTEKIPKRKDLLKTDWRMAMEMERKQFERTLTVSEVSTPSNDG